LGVEQVDPRDKRIAELEAKVAELEKALAKALAENARLKARLGMNSTNSSLAPSSERQRGDRPKKEPSGRKRGGQVGHEPHQRRLLPPERVDKFVDVRPDACERSGKSLRGNDAAPRRHQVIDLVPKLVLAVEYRLHALVCRDCRVVTRARLPAGVPKGGYGPKILALMACLSGRFLLSKRLVTEFFADVLDVETRHGLPG
jgi:transposase